ncbi:glycoside hydrolase family 13 protein [Exidia glandulosa HHB12029]|uniref:Alpha-amylase n=1 Tax=Exidia glandulosa HHB12029 TaxID=1314781 RepID=A0A165NXQ6_EXIGL|nr:glycoside hydrolase family 13 protein [Exidia glandulosa HHB12029]
MTRLSTQFAALAALASCAAAQKDTIVQMFGWNWDSIAQECTQFLGPAGYGYVQISPPQETVTGDQWWTDYQPVSYNLQGKRGDRAALASMIEACHKVGVKVIADAVINHMTGSDAGTGTAGTSYQHYEYPGLYTHDSFHHCGLEPGDNIVNYDSREEVQTCQLVNLADLDTGKDEVQTAIAGYLSDLMSLGVDGLRLDASKHMAATEINGILGKMTTSPQYVTQEVIFGAGEPILPSEYTGNGNVQEFRFTSTLQDAFSSGGISSLVDTIPGESWLASGDANVFVANHDTERNDASLNYLSPSNTYTLAHVFMLAYPYGTPSVLSSYEYAGYDDGAPNSATGTCFGEGGVNSWLCQHRFPPIAGLTAFRGAVSGDVSNIQKGTAQQLAFSRGTTGFVAINNEDATWTGSFSTGLAAGNYCNVYEGARNTTGDCAASFVTVDDQGAASLNIAPRSAVAIYVGAEAPTGAVQPEPSASTTGESAPAPTAQSPSPSPAPSTPAPTSNVVNFSVVRNTTFGDNVFVVGSIPALGTWDPSKSVALSSATYPIWATSVNIADGTDFEYKYIVKKGNGEVEWEADPNREGLTKSSAVETFQ